MTEAFHGTPITPNRALSVLGARNFCVSFYRPDQISFVAALARKVMIDNGAFSAWRKGLLLDAAYWARFYYFVAVWLEQCAPGSWFVVPDVIDAGTQAQDALIRELPAELTPHAVPVWHMDEPVSRLLSLCERFPRVCIGSTAEFTIIGTPPWRERMDEAWDVMAGTFGDLPQIHMLRGMQCVLPTFDYPFASVDSTDLARNHSRIRRRYGAAHWEWGLRQRADRWDAMATANPSIWIARADRQLRLAL